LQKPRSSTPIFLIYAVLFIMGVKTFMPMLFDKSYVKGESFRVRIPKGWTVQKQKNEIIFTSPEADMVTEMPDAIFSIYAEKQKNAIFMDDFFPEVLASLARENGKVLSTGEELIDKQPAKWILFRYNKPNVAVMTLYIVDDYNRLTRIQYVGAGKHFKEYGKAFDDFKKSIILK
jgi:hypothetical protein